MDGKRTRGAWAKRGCAVVLVEVATDRDSGDGLRVMWVLALVGVGVGKGWWWSGVRIVARPFASARADGNEVQ